MMVVRMMIIIMMTIWWWLWSGWWQKKMQTSNKTNNQNSQDRKKLNSKMHKLGLSSHGNNQRVNLIAKIITHLSLHLGSWVVPEKDILIMKYIFKIRKYSYVVHIRNNSIICFKLWNALYTFLSGNLTTGIFVPCDVDDKQRINNYSTSAQSVEWNKFVEAIVVGLLNG